MRKIAYTIDQATEVSSIGRSKLYKFIKSGELPTVKVGRRTLIEHKSLETLLRRHVVKAGDGS